MHSSFRLSCCVRIAVFLLLSPFGLAATPLSLTNLRCEYKTNPIGIDVSKPRMSWELVSSERGTLQSAYQAQVAASIDDLRKNKVLWDSGRQNSDASIHIVYAGPALQSEKRYYWQVRVWDNQGRSSGWSEPAYWEMGLLQPSDWKAHWITPNLKEEPAKSNPSPMLRHVFETRGNVASARLYASAMGLYEIELNGKRVGDQYFTPGWTAYDFRYQYQTFDVTDMLKSGKNAMGATLGDGWFRGFMTWDANRDSYGTKLALLAQLVITYKDGKRQIVGTDESWKAATGPILSSDIYNGETYDARLERAGWSESAFDDKDWSAVGVLDPPKAALVAPAGPPVRPIEEIKPVKLIKTPGGDTVIDMGQNMVGWVRMRVTAPTGTEITLRHAEVLDSKGNFYTENLRAAKETNRYIAKGQGVETFAPHFTFQGFRYVAVSGWPGEVPLDAFTGIVVHSAIERSGTFETSDAMLNKLEHNIIWGQKGNFVDVPTDCPQRDERLGWTGDAEVFSRTACFNHDSAAFYTKWLKDLALDQQDDGAVPHVIPNVLSHKTRKGDAAAPGWADVATVVPWTVYLSYGDRRILEEQYPSMKAWVEYMRRTAGDQYIWKTGDAFGDWLAFATNDSDYPGATTDKDLIKTAYFARSTDLLRATAEVLGKKEDAENYAALLDHVRTAFQREFVTPNGRVASNTQTAYSLALAFDLLPESQRQQAAARLAEDVRHFEHITTGFLGTPLICKVLSDYGYFNEAYMLLNRKEYPSWLYPITKDATTIWERWDGIKPDGSFQDPGMNSFNHYAYGAIGEWMYRVIAGIEIDPQQPGYKHFLIQPHPGGGLTFAKGSVHSMYGKVASSWDLKDGQMTVRVEIPANTSATIRLPQAKLADSMEGGKPLGSGLGLSGARQGEGFVSVEAGSGSYEFQYPAAK
ncbi:MAG TPA: glycoside hydrolase family 78 protein [Candidatus Sulfotelmatobacter sp.]|nr:glycoside hydrolase family 78 protein [Candidatus Sulfotelmatobacter sp.]